MAALNGGFHIAFLLGALLIFGAIAAAFAILRSPKPEEMAAMMAEHPEEAASAEAALSEAA